MKTMNKPTNSQGNREKALIAILHATNENMKVFCESFAEKRSKIANKNGSRMKKYCRKTIKQLKHSLNREQMNSVSDKYMKWGQQPDNAQTNEDVNGNLNQWIKKYPNLYDLTHQKQLAKRIIHKFISMNVDILNSKENGTIQERGRGEFIMELTNYYYCYFFDCQLEQELDDTNMMKKIKSRLPFYENGLSSESKKTENGYEIERKRNQQRKVKNIRLTSQCFPSLNDASKFKRKEDLICQAALNELMWEDDWSNNWIQLFDCSEVDECSLNIQTKSENLSTDSDKQQKIRI